MAGNVTPIRSVWQPVADASDQIAALVTDLPAWSGYRYSIESQVELRRAAELLAQAIPLLERVSKREGTPGCEEACHE
jgi:hypothetical protein